MTRVEFVPAQRPGNEEIAWRHIWLKSVMLDSGRELASRRFRPTARKLTLRQRLRRLHRLREVLEE
jgi:hypothetical protein